MLNNIEPEQNRVQRVINAIAISGMALSMLAVIGLIGLYGVILVSFLQRKGIL